MKASKAAGKKRANKGSKPSPKPAKAAAPAAKKPFSLDTLSELIFCRDLGRLADDELEECAKLRLSLRSTLARFLPMISKKIGATAALIRTRNEDLKDETFTHGLWSNDDTAALVRPAFATVAKSKDGKRTIIAQRLDVAGEKVGVAAFAFNGDRTGDKAQLAGRIDVVSEELDGVLAAIQLASVKQDLILRVGQALRNLVFDRGVDDALAILRGAIPLNEFVLLYHDEASNDPHNSLRYRIYREATCVHDSESHPHAQLAELLALDDDHEVLESRDLILNILGLEGAVESVLISGITSTRLLGKIFVTSRTGLSTFGMDLLRVFAESVSQRLVDYNRERRHLSQFFSPLVINELLRDPAYDERYLKPKTDEVGLIYADINSFTKISEQVLLDPAKIGRFVDKWSAGAVDILWKNGGVFDKMVGDCVIGIFGPPFFRTDRKTRIASAVKAAREIMAFTVSLESDPDLAPIVTSGVVQGLGVAVGVNLCPASVGLFGPNQDFTAFSSGMNATARLQSLAGFREILVMDAARDVLEDELRDASFEGPVESPVKNVAKPLRFYRVKFPEMKPRK